MDNNGIYFSRHIYNLVDDTNESYKLYSRSDFFGSKKHLTNIIKIELFAGKSNGKGFIDMLRLKKGDTWVNSELVTGLKPTIIQNVFEGNRVKIENGKKTPDSWLLFEFSEDLKTLVIDYFNHFYTFNPFKKRYLLKSHEYFLKHKKGA